MIPAWQVLWTIFPTLFGGGLWKTESTKSPEPTPKKKENIFYYGYTGNKITFEVIQATKEIICHWDVRDYFGALDDNLQQWGKAIPEKEAIELGGSKALPRYIKHKYDS